MGQVKKQGAHFKKENRSNPDFSTDKNKFVSTGKAIGRKSIGQAKKEYVPTGTPRGRKTKHIIK